jgi:N-acetylmuramoyl-L-alanine amidase
MTVIDRPAHRNGYGAGRRGFVVDTVVLHTTESTAGSALIWFADPRAKSAAHYVIAPDGRVYRCVPEEVPAWHAGNFGVNLSSIGIECAGYHDKLATWTGALVESLILLLVDICERYPNVKPTRNHIIGHSEVPDGRGGFGGAGNHTDPGTLVPWDYIIGEVQRRLAGNEAPTGEIA